MIVVGIVVAIVKPWGTSAPDRSPGQRPRRRRPPPRPRAVVPHRSMPSPATITSCSGSTNPSRTGSCGPPGTSSRSATRSVSGARIPRSAPAQSRQERRHRLADRSRTGQDGRPASDGPHWPATITIADGNNLGLIGINTPLGYEIASVDDRADEGRRHRAAVAVVKPQSQWPSHFTVIGIADDTGREAIENWPAGASTASTFVRPGAISPVDRDLPSAEPSPAESVAVPVAEPGTRSRRLPRLRS